jgi:hypothetical protein
LLTHEFEEIFSDLFGKRSEKYKKIVELLVQGSLEYGEICEKLKVGKSGWCLKFCTIFFCFLLILS